jgi:hypothetical protein
VANVADSLSQNNSNQRVTNAVLGVKLDMVIAKLNEICDTQHEYGERIRANELEIAGLKTQSRIGDGLTAAGAFVAALIGVFVKPQ